MKNKDHIARDGSLISIWQDNTMRQTGVTTVEDSLFDVLIIGGGITGISTALMLQKAGQRCVIAEGKAPGFGSTGGTSAHLNTFFDATYSEIESDFSADTAKLVAQAGKEAFSILKGFIDHYQIDCDFEYKDGYVFSENEKESKELKDILEASAHAGIEVRATNKNGVPIPFENSIVFRDQGQFHPLKYINALAKEFISLGGLIMEDTWIIETIYKDQVHTAIGDRASVKAKHLVYATHIPPGINVLSLKCAPYRSYVLGIKLKDDAYPDDLIYDMQEPYHYFRTHVINGKKYLLLGGEDHKTGHADPEKAFENLEAYARQYYQVDVVAYKWSSQYYVPVDGLPYIGAFPGGQKHTFVATGFNGNGMMFGTLSAKIISDQILGNENLFAELFSPSRMKPVAGFTDFVRENADVAYHFVVDRFTAEELNSIKELAPGDGMVAKFQGEKLAIYKDESGKVTALNPTCTHAGCMVNFNSAEKSWDCPCHGGRFDISGKVLTGPPLKDLEQLIYPKILGSNCYFYIRKCSIITVLNVYAI